MLCWVTSVVSDSVRPHRQQPTRLCHPSDSPGKNTGVGCHFLLQCMKAKSESEVAQSCPTLCDPMDCSLPGSPVHGIFRARVLEWGAIAFSVFMNRKLLFPFSLYKWSAHFYLFYFNISVTSSVYQSFPGHPISSRLFCPFAPFTKLGKLKILLHPFPWSLGSVPPPPPQNPNPAPCTPQDLLKQNSKDRILTFKEATTECELVIKPVTKEVGRCHEPKTQREG